MNRTMNTAMLGCAALLALLLVPRASGATGVVHPPSHATCRRDRDDRIATTLEATFDAPIDEVFRFMVAEDVLPKILHGYGPIPAVKHTHVLHGPWDTVGADRIVYFEDGGTVHEQITAIAPSRMYRYRIDDFHSLLSIFAKNGQGDWTFEQIGGRTHVRWTYSFAPKNAFMRAPLSLFVKTVYRGFMEQTLRLSVPYLRRDRVR